MTDRYNGLVVAFDHDIREDDAEAVINAIRMLKGVLTVTANVSDINSHIEETRAKRDLPDKLYEVLNK